MSTHETSKRLALVSLVTAYVIGALFCVPQAAQAQPSEVIPICGIVAGPDEWNDLDPAVSLAGDVQYLENIVEKGLHYGCAAQLRMTSRQVEDENGRLIWESVGLTTLPSGRAVPDVIDPLDGESQRLFLSVDDPGLSRFAGCYPGTSLDPDDICPANVYTPGFGIDAGTMIYRFREDDGTFSGAWRVSRGQRRPGFVIRKFGECEDIGTGCEYEIIFFKESDAVHDYTLEKDVQVLLQVPIQLETIPETGAGFNSSMAIPLLVRFSNSQDDTDPDATPTPSGGDDPDVRGEANTQATAITTQLQSAARKPKGLTPEEKQAIKDARKSVKAAISALLAFVKQNGQVTTSCKSTSVKNLKRARTKSRKAKSSTKKWTKLIRFFARITSCLG